MFTFTDIKDQVWEIDLNLGTLFQITNGGIDFSEVGDVNLTSPDEETLKQINFNPAVSIPIIYFCVKDNLSNKVDSKGNPLSESSTPDVAFYSLFSSETIRDASGKLLLEIANFFPLLATTIPNLTKTFSSLEKNMKEVMDQEDLITDQEMKTILRQGIKNTKKQMIEANNSGE